MSENLSFADLGLSQDIVSNLAKIGFTTPTPIQANSIPELLGGTRDILGLAQTGTGKTASFALPIIEGLDPSNRGVQALILAPTRELAKQITEEFHRLKGPERRLKITSIYGGSSYENQLRALKQGAQVVVGTPGRVIDLLDRKALKLNGLTHLVLDEADDMLNMGFIDDIEKILTFAPESRRMLLFSATMPPQLNRIVDRYMKEKLEINLRPKELTTALTEQVYYEVYESDKFEVLQRVIKANPEFYGIVFCHTKAETDDVNHQLIRSGFSSDALHGDISQNQREKIVHRFKTKKLQVLVATDVAARGVDVKALTHVVNYTLPNHPESYVHRIGRTGRAGEKGIAISLVSPGERRRLRSVQDVAKGKIQKEAPPTVPAIIKAQKQKIFGRLANALDSINGSDEEKAYQHYFSLSKNILEDVPPNEAIAALLQISFGSSLNETEYRPIKVPTFDRRRGGGDYRRGGGGSGYRRGGGYGGNRYGGHGGNGGGSRRYSNHRSSGQGSYQGEKSSSRSTNRRDGRRANEGR
ncbi:MAG: DEAD/DEAH box helicase [Pseudobacteriovorax sp.]|nr:DEAD/DEAH box helicase [Pseudobacteriovorax sp.]